MTAGDPTGAGDLRATDTGPAADVPPASAEDGSPVAVPAAGTAAEEPEVRRGVTPETVADLVITVLLLVLFGWAFLEANQWSDRAALFPHLVCGTMFVLSALHLIQVLLRARREMTGARVAAEAAGRSTSGQVPAGHEASGHDASGHLLPGHVAQPHGNEDDVNEDDVEYVFQTAGARRWAGALGWILGFFVLLYVAGLFITAPVFSLLYLRLAGRRTWLFSVIYAVVAGLVLYLAFEVALSIPTPPGLFLD